MSLSSSSVVLLYFIPGVSVYSQERIPKNKALQIKSAMDFSPSEMARSNTFSKVDNGRGACCIGGGSSVIYPRI